MDASGSREGEILAGLRFLLEEMKELRIDVQQALGSAAEDRKRADEDRRRADERFERLMVRMDDDRKRSDRRFDRLMTGVVDVGRRILRTQREHTRLLQAILRGVLTRRNGPQGNGNSRPRR